ncbi:hypothetical protein BN85400100 [Alteracholeplasma palmae J233]|uniref:Uncharacterized protein n=1 Tax=Alteracholeplasma palmae (strain ATCC 49389 / J233) TaxID=1318466 RepID=U4KJL3_ALTPJ|nr:hypothetical protein [Alteracholeplasma palmae]CCV63587.1 hypothetical protein BN85400100 [Alteracholeplasma palmae J233]
MQARTIQPTHQESGQLIYDFIKQKSYVEAYRLSKKIESSLSKLDLINYALCLIKMNKEQEAILALEKAFLQNQRLMETTPEYNQEEINLLKIEDKEKTYLLPINPNLTYGKKYIEYRIERLLYDLYKQTNNTFKINTIVNKYKKYDLESLRGN